MIFPYCHTCGWELEQPGAIVLSPPTQKHHELVAKLHICKVCWDNKLAPMLASNFTRQQTAPGGDSPAP